MKKIDALIQKIEVFEKLAVYGDRTSFLKSLAQVAAFPPEGLSQSLSALGNRLNTIAREWERVDAASKMDAQSLRDYGRAFEQASFPSYTSSREQLDEKIRDLRRFRDNTLPLLKKVNPTLASQVAPAQEELGKIEQFINGFMRNTMGVSYPGEPSSTEAPKDVATQAPAAAKPQAPMSTLARQLANRMTNVAKTQLAPLAENDPKRAAVVKQIETMAAQLKKMHDALKAKKNATLEDRFALIGISNAFQETYGTMSYDDLQKAPTFEFGRSSAFEQE